MGHRELFLTIGAMIIFSMTTLSISTHSVTNSGAIYEQQAQLLAIQTAQKYIEEAKSLAFDESVITKGNALPSDFTTSLGPGIGESYPNYYDDVDDFNTLSRTDTTSIGLVKVEVQVSYVSADDLETFISTPTYYKAMQVKVTNDYLSDPIYANYVFAYQRN